MPKLLYFTTEDWYFCSHRLPLAREAVKSGFEVVLLTRVQSHRDIIESAGIRVIHLDMQRRSMNPYRELKTLWKVYSVFRDERPVVVHLVALKPIIYGVVAACLARIQRVVCAISGLGYIFTSRHLKASLLRPPLKILLRFLLNKPGVHVIVQNPDDRDQLVNAVRVERKRIVLIRGAGVDLELFTPNSEVTDGAQVVILASRMLWDKGVGEFVAAAMILRKQGTMARLALVGDPDPENPASIPKAQLRAWQRAGVVEWWGQSDDMPEVFGRAHIVCLPTAYGEGVPKVLLEAAACGKAIIASDAPGCREIVRHGENGLLVPVKDSEALASAIRRLVEDPELRRRMGVRSREIAVQEFSVVTVVTDTLALYQRLLVS